MAEWFDTLSPTLQGVLLGQLGPLSLFLLGGAGWLVRHFLQTKARRREFTRQKLEQVLESLLAVDDWIDEQFERRMTGKVIAIRSPALRVHALINAYYPPLAQPAKDLHGYTLAWATQLGLANETTEPAALQPHTQNVVDSQLKLVDATAAAIREL